MSRLPNVSTTDSRKRRASGIWRSKDEQAFFWISLAPAVLITASIVLVPIGYTVVLSFFAADTLGSRTVFIGLGNFIELAADAQVWRALGHSILFAVGSTALSTVLGVLAALALNQKFWGREFLKAAALFSYVVPTIVVALMFKLLFNSNGIVTLLLKDLGFVAGFVPVLGDTRYAMLAVVVISSWAWFPFTMINCLAGLQMIPVNLYESAAIDGANNVRTFSAITLPLLLPTLLVTVLVRLIWAFRTFDLVWLLTQGGPIDVTTVLPIVAYREAFGTYRMGYASAIATVLMAFLSLIAIGYFRAYRAVKRTGLGDAYGR